MKYIVSHTFVAVDRGRQYDTYSIYKNCIFRAPIKYLFIGLNPSADNDEFADDTNLWIINWILKEGKSGDIILQIFMIISVQRILCLMAI